MSETLIFHTLSNPDKLLCVALATDSLARRSVQELLYEAWRPALSVRDLDGDTPVALGELAVQSPARGLGGPATCRWSLAEGQQVCPTFCIVCPKRVLSASSITREHRTGKQGGGRGETVGTKPLLALYRGVVQGRRLSLEIDDSTSGSL